MSAKSDRERFGFGDAGELGEITTQATDKVKAGLSKISQVVETSHNVFFDKANDSIDMVGSVVGKAENSFTSLVGLGEKALSHVISRAVQLGDRKSEE